MGGYLSSRKDQISLDLQVEVDLQKNFYSIRGYDTLLGKERFYFFYEDGQWKITEEGHTYPVNSSESLAGFLPAPELFDYTAFLRGEIPVLREALQTREDDYDVFKKGNFTQKNLTGADGVPKEILLFFQDRKIFQFVYQDILSVSGRFFPKNLVIYDYGEKRKILWWLSKIEKN